MEGTGVASEKAHALLKDVAEASGEVPAFDVGIIGNIGAGKGNGFDDEGGQAHLRVPSKEQCSGEIEGARPGEVHVF